METKIALVRKHLLEKGSITSWEAIQEYGATRLSAIIFILRHKEEMPIKTRDKAFTDRYGNKSTFAEYYLTDINEEDEEEDEN